MYGFGTFYFVLIKFPRVYRQSNCLSIKPLPMVIKLYSTKGCKVTLFVRMLLVYIMCIECLYV